MRKQGLCKQDLIIICDALKNSLKTCKCYWSDLEPCAKCAKVQPVLNIVSPMVDVLLNKKSKSEFVSEIEILE